MARLAVEWRRLRLGLGLTQADMADVLGVTTRSVRRLEVDEAGPGPAVLARLAFYLTLRGPRERLRRAGVAHPFEAERAAAVRVWNRTVRRNPAGPARSCPVCGVALGLHARCRSCPQLLGDAHGQPIAADGLCRGCREASRRANRGRYPLRKRP